MRAFLLPFLFALLCAFPAKVLAADGNDGLRTFINGSWQIAFAHEIQGDDGTTRSANVLVTITLRYDGTRTITTDVLEEGKPTVRADESNDYYRVDDIDGTKFTFTSWSDTAPAQTTNRLRSGADTMMVEGNETIYQRVAGSQEAVPASLPPQRDPPAATQESRDAAMRAFMVGRWTATVVQNGQTIVSIIDYAADGQLSGTQSVTTNGQTQNYSVKGAYTVTATGEKNFTLAITIPGIAPFSSDLQIVDQNTLFNAKDNYSAIRTP